MKAHLETEGVVTSIDHTLCDQDAIAELVRESGFRVRCTVYTHPVYPKMQEHPHSRYEGPNFSGKASSLA